LVLVYKLNIVRSEISLSIFLLFLLMFLVAGCGIRSSNLAKEYNDYGVNCARMGLWNEAIMRWKRIVEIDPNNAQAHNNLGVAYESKGEFEAALAKYRTAVELDPDNRVYMSNYIKFKRNYERASKGD
jgi:Flp pilus assembly protein TadD